MYEIHSQVHDVHDLVTRTGIWCLMRKIWVFVNARYLQEFGERWPYHTSSESRCWGVAATVCLRRRAHTLLDRA